MFVLKKAYKRITELHPNESLKKNAKHLSQEWKTLIAVIERRIWLYMIIIIITLALLLSYLIYEFVTTFWGENSLNLEPKFTALGLIIFLWLSLMGLFFLSQRKPDNTISICLLKFLNSLNKSLVTFWFLRKSINLEWIKGLIKETKKEDS